MRKKTLLTPLISAVLIYSCGTNFGGADLAKVEETNDGKILIIDDTGKEWDVTHAVKQYGFVASQFQFGLGPNAIRPILNPKHLSPGDPGYPAPNATFAVLGVSIEGDARAYPISVLAVHEIADEVFGETHVAAAF